MDVIDHLLDDAIIIGTLVVVIYYVQLLERKSRLRNTWMRWTRRIALLGAAGGLIWQAYYVAAGIIMVQPPGYLISVAIVTYFGVQIWMLKSDRDPDEGP